MEGNRGNYCYKQVEEILYLEVLRYIKQREKDLKQATPFECFGGLIYG